MSDTQPKLQKPRAIERMVNRREHREGHHATNFLADLADLIAAPDEAVSIETKTFLLRLKHRALRPDLGAPDGASVFLSRQHFRSFNRLRHELIHFRMRAAIAAGKLPQHTSVRR